MSTATEDVQQDNTSKGRILVTGQGVSQGTQPTDDIASIFPWLYQPQSRESDIGLIQGGVQVGSVEKGMTIAFDTLFGYWLRNGEDRTIPTQAELTDKFEKDAFSMAYHVYNACLERVHNESGKLISNVQMQPNKVDRYLTILLDSVETMKDKTMIDLNERFGRLYRLRDEKGFFRWIGLGTLNDRGQVFPPSTVMVVPAMIQGVRQILFRANTIPYQPGTSSPILPYEGNIAHVVNAGMIHAFEYQSTWRSECALRAAELYYTYKGNYNLTRMMASGARANMFPRLSSVDGRGYYMWERLAALSMASDFFSMYYGLAAPPLNTGEVRYTFSGSGVDKVLESIVNLYLGTSLWRIDRSNTNSRSGLFFMPSSNASGSAYMLSFAGNPQTEKGYTILEANDERSLNYFNYANEPLTIDERGKVLVTTEQQKSDQFYPLKIVPTHTVYSETEFLGAGFERPVLKITDVLNEGEVWKPSQFIESLVLGWPVSFVPRAIVLRRTQFPCRLEEFRGIQLMATGQSTGLARRALMGGQLG